MSINITLYPQPILIDLGLSAICRMVSKRCPEGVWMTLSTAWMVIMPNQLLKLQWRNIEYCFNRLVPFLSMTLDWPLSFLFWGVCRVSGRFLGVVLGYLTDSGYCLGRLGWWGVRRGIIDKNLIRVILISWFLLSQVPRNVWRLSGKCLRGVWGLSEWLWILFGLSGYCLGGYDVQASDKHPMEYSILAGFLTPCAVLGVSVGCLEGVWEVSGGCLSEYGYCLGGMMCKQLINTQWKILY